MLRPNGAPACSHGCSQVAATERNPWKIRPPASAPEGRRNHHRSTTNPAEEHVPRETRRRLAHSFFGNRNRFPGIGRRHQRPRRPAFPTHTGTDDGQCRDLRKCRPAKKRGATVRAIACPKRSPKSRGGPKPRAAPERKPNPQKRRPKQHGERRVLLLGRQYIESVDQIMIPNHRIPSAKPQFTAHRNLAKKSLRLRRIPHSFLKRPLEHPHPLLCLPRDELGLNPRLAERTDAALPAPFSR